MACLWPKSLCASLSQIRSPPTQVPESGVLALIEALGAERAAGPGIEILVENVAGNRAREEIDDGG